MLHVIFRAALLASGSPVYGEICDDVQRRFVEKGVGNLVFEAGKDWYNLSKGNPGEAAEREWRARWFLRLRESAPALEEVRAQRADGVARFDAMYAALPSDSPFRTQLKEYSEVLHSDWNNYAALHQRIRTMRRVEDMPEREKILEEYLGGTGDLFGLKRGGYCSPFVPASDRLPHLWQQPFRMLEAADHPAFAVRVSRVVSVPELGAPFKFNPETRTLLIQAIRTRYSRPGVCLPLGAGGFFYLWPTVSLPYTGTSWDLPKEPAWRDMMRKLQMKPIPADLIDRSLQPPSETAAPPLK